MIPGPGYGEEGDPEPDGCSWVSGIAAGIRGSKADVEAAAVEVALSAMFATRSYLQIKSPSKVTDKLRQYTGDGYVNGVLARVDAAPAAARDLVDVASFGARAATTW